MTINFEPIASVEVVERFFLEDMYVIRKDGAELLTPGGAPTRLRKSKARCDESFQRYRKLALVLCTWLALTSACTKWDKSPLLIRPAAPSHRTVVMRDVTFTARHSTAKCRTGRDAGQRPNRSEVPPWSTSFRGAGNFRDWTNYSDVARFAERGLILCHARRRRVATTPTRPTILSSATRITA